MRNLPELICVVFNFMFVCRKISIITPKLIHLTILIFNTLNFQYIDKNTRKILKYIHILYLQEPTLINLLSYTIDKIYVLVTSVVVKIAPIGTRTRICHSRVRRSAGLSIPGQDIYFMSYSVFTCALRSLYSALNSIPLHISTSNF